MASNYTENYQLPLWAADDAFLRAEFNDAHEKIEEAIMAAQDRVKLLEITTTQDSALVNLDVSGIDFTAYRCVTLHVKNLRASSPVVYIRLNNITSADAYYSGGSQTVSYLLGINTDATFGTSGEITFWGRGNILGATSVLCSYFSARQCGEIQRGAGGAAPSILQPENLNSIQFLTMGSGEKISAGVNIQAVGYLL